MNDLKNMLTTLGSKLKPLWRYRLLAFLVFVAALCTYELLQINSASSTTATDSAISSGPAAPHLDESVVNQLKQLQDNSVSVKAIFNQQDRDNPFK